MQVKTILVSKTKKFWKVENNKDTGVCDQTTYSITLQCWLLSSSTIRYSKTLYIQTPKWNKESLKLAYSKWLENLVMGNLILNVLPGGLLAGFYCWYHYIVYNICVKKHTVVEQWLVILKQAFFLFGFSLLSFLSLCTFYFISNDSLLNSLLKFPIIFFRLTTEWCR